eukprot:7023322-Pyramimonas_sp.AAC.1
MSLSHTGRDVGAKDASGPSHLLPPPNAPTPTPRCVLSCGAGVVPGANCISCGGLASVRAGRRLLDDRGPP